jgi:beta-phosphoglucomutase
MTLALPKVGLGSDSARALVGELYLADIGVPPELYASPSLGLEVGHLFSESDIVRIEQAKLTDSLWPEETPRASQYFDRAARHPGSRTGETSRRRRLIQAVIFDLDGTLVQTEKLKAQSYAQAAQRLRPDVSIEPVLEAFKHVVGRSRQEVAEYLLDTFDLADAATAYAGASSSQHPWQSFVEVRLAIYERMIADESVIRENRWPSALQLLEVIREGCELIGLATMSHRSQATRVLSILGVTDAFDVVATRDDVEHGKPAPEIYHLVLGELDVKPRGALAIEDSPSGVRAAMAAGVDVIAVGTDFTRAALHAAPDIPEDRIVDDPSTLIATVSRVMHERQ